MWIGGRKGSWYGEITLYGKKDDAEIKHCRFINRKDGKKLIIDFSIINVHLYVFWNHVGMVCYEIDNVSCDHLSTEDFLFENAFVEFGNNDSDMFSVAIFRTSRNNSGLQSDVYIFKNSEDKKGNTKSTPVARPFLCSWISFWSSDRCLSKTKMCV